MKKEDLQTELEKYYQSAKNPAESVSKAMSFIQEKLDLETEQPTDSPEPMDTVAPEAPQEQTSGGSPLGTILVILVLLGAAGGGGYYWYLQKQRQREAAQRMAQKRVAQQNKAMAGKDGNRTGRPSATPAQNSARVRTGNYTESAGSSRPKATPTATPGNGQNSGRTYGAGQKNPYGRYTSSDTEEESSYTASFKPNTGNNGVRRNNRNPEDLTYRRAADDQQYRKDPDDQPFRRKPEEKPVSRDPDDQLPGT